VVKLHAKAGEAVRAGQGLVTFEAMKMRNELRSPKDGKVVQLGAAEGQVVEMGAALVTVE
jgi:biotin carboxyl carrier protein